VFTAVMLWLTVIVGTYIIFPPYRVTPPPGTTDLGQFPVRSCSRTRAPRGSTRLRWKSRSTCRGSQRC
jgi:hypothetical protein